METDGPGVNFNHALLQFSITGCSAQCVAWVSSLGAKKLHAWGGTELAESEHRGSAEPANGSEQRAQSITQPRDKWF